MRSGIGSTPKRRSFSTNFTSACRVTTQASRKLRCTGSSALERAVHGIGIAAKPLLERIEAGGHARRARQDRRRRRASATWPARCSASASGWACSQKTVGSRSRRSHSASSPVSVTATAESSPQRAKGSSSAIVVGTAVERLRQPRAQPVQDDVGQLRLLEAVDDRARAWRGRGVLAAPASVVARCRRGQAPLVQDAPVARGPIAQAAGRTRAV